MHLVASGVHTVVIWSRLSTTSRVRATSVIAASLDGSRIGWTGPFLHIAINSVSSIYQSASDLCFSLCGSTTKWSGMRLRQLSCGKNDKCYFSLLSPSLVWTIPDISAGRHLCASHPTTTTLTKDIVLGGKRQLCIAISRTIL